MNKLNNTWKNKRIKEETKIRIFNSLISSIFLYNSELWTTNKTLEKQINSFQRRLLRRVINIHWPNKISNEALLKRTKAEPWDKTIKRRRLNFIGHLARLPTEAPAKIALSEAIREVPKPQGRQKHTWLKQVNIDLQDTELNIEDNHTYHVAANRVNWTKIVRRVMSKDGRPHN